MIVKTVMMAGDKRGCEIVFCGFDAIQSRTSEVWAAHFMVTLTPAHTSAHVQHGDTGVGAGVVGLVTKILTVLIGIVTLKGSIGVVTESGHGQRPTFTAETITRVVIRFPGAATPGWDAAELIIIPGPECAR